MRKALLAASAVLLCSTAFATANTTELKTTLQASLERGLQRAMIDGALNHFDLATGEINQFFPTERHAMIVQIGDSFVMCADLTTKEGGSVPVDFYMVENGSRYSIIRTEINNREPLKALMEQGIAKALK